MDKAAILGIYNFVSFQVCQTLLNKGIEVNGIHIDTKTEQFLDEKRLEIGRNANFTENSFSEWKDSKQKESNKEKMILSIYDLFMLGEESILHDERVLNPVLQYLDQYKDEANIIIIAPIQALAESIPSIDRFLEKTRGGEDTIQFIYLPAIFGPWQPQVFMFQQAIVSSIQKGEVSLSDREWTEDALFAEDAAETIVEIIDEGKPGRYLLESGRKGYWQQCAAYLDEGLLKGMNRESIQINSPVTRVHVKNITPIAKAFSIQKEYVKLHCITKR
ncbi:hypothetical protein [Neobacillus mesonae]|uniref:hypothetical protein n=1 Tax=Neobacillus mesonae TaxID=1193713 RepID=UPI00203CB9E6|nr:hypothetical protein [Neobacillus mesonae]MCM3570008.1 hypothetical protein [Neobacillus mesonae]